MTRSIGMSRHGPSVRVVEQDAGARDLAREHVARVVQRAHVEGQAAAADAPAEVVAEPLEQPMRSASSGRHALDRRAQSCRVGVRFSGSDAIAVRISSRLRPTCWAMRMNETRRNVSRV